MNIDTGSVMNDLGELRVKETRNGTHIIYTREQADMAGISYKNWNDTSTQKGDWILTDDNYVLQILNLYDCRGKRPSSGRLFRTCVGGANQTGSKTYRVDSDEGKMGNAYYQKDPPASPMEKRAVDLILGGMPQMEAIQTIFPNNKNPKRKLREVMMKKSVVEYMTEQMKTAFREAGMDETWIAERLKEEATNPDNYGNVRMDAIKTVAKLSGIDGTKTITEAQETVTAYLDDGDLDKLEGRRSVKRVDE